MDVKTLYRQFGEFARAARDDLGEGAAATELSAIFAIDEEEFERFWARISLHEELHRTWIDRLTRGYAAVKADLNAAFEADAKRHGPAVADQIDHEAA